ncbi:MAG: hypothetical protein Q7S06_02470 [Nanoarchaeota archaeon]|nr:hypothetical protein [Nanoarchaeota archaeon]
MKLIGFERNEEIEDPIRSAVDKGLYVVVYARGQNKTFSGLARRISGELLILSPFLGTDYASGTPKTALISGDCPIRIEDISVIEPIDFTNFMAYCNYTNKMREESNTKTEQKSNKTE